MKQLTIETRQDLEIALKSYGLKFHKATSMSGETLITFKFNWWNKRRKIKIMKKAHKELSPYFIISLYPVIFEAI